VGAPTELDGEVPDLDHPNSVAVLVPEEGQSTHLLCLVFGGNRGRHGGVADQPPIGLPFDLRHLLVAQGREVGEVEAEAAGLYQRSCLGGVVSDHCSQGPVENMRPGMALTNSLPAWRIDRQIDLLTYPEAPRLDRDPVAVQALDGVVGVLDHADRAFVGHHAPVSDLSA
jgi:hypothetical protein